MEVHPKMKRLDNAIYNYMIRKNLHTVADIFAKEANVSVIKASVFAPIADTDIASEVLEDWSSIFLDAYYTRLQNDHTAQSNMLPQSTSVSNSRKGKFDWTGEDIFQSGLFPRPLNPYFVTKIRPYKENELRIPADVINNHKIELPEEITLVDPSGREFHAKRRIWKDGTTLYTGGWKTLCETNVVTYNESCICEFIRYPCEFRPIAWPGVLFNFSKKSSGKPYFSL